MRSDDDVLVAISQGNFDQLILILQVDCAQTALTDILEFRSGCPFDGTHPCREEQVISVLWAAFDVDDGLDFFVGIQIQQVNDRQTFCLAAVLNTS